VQLDCYVNWAFESSRETAISNSKSGKSWEYIGDGWQRRRLDI